MELYQTVGQKKKKTHAELFVSFLDKPRPNCRDREKEPDALLSIIICFISDLQRMWINIVVV